MTNKTTTVTQNLIVTCNRVIMMTLLLAVVAGGAYSQNTTSNPLDGYTPTGLAPGSPVGSYALSGFDTINPYSGGMNFTLPILSIGGRGGAGYTIHLPIEQKWSVNHSTAGQSSFYEPELNAFISGTRAGYGPGALFGRQVASEYAHCDSPDSFLPTKTLTRFTFVTPDGTQYELRDVKSDGQPVSVGVCGLNGTSRGRVFKTADGSSATFISDQPVVDEIFIQTGIIGATGYLFLSDGTRYRVMNGDIRSMSDRNGNTITFEYNGVGVTSIKDSLNREVTIEYNVQDEAPYGLCDRIKYRGFDGTLRIIRISYDSLGNVLRGDSSVQNCSALFHELNNSSSSNPCSGSVLVSAVWLPDLPDHSDRRSYRFHYNSYSELARVDLPTGGAFEYDWEGGYRNGPASGAVCFDCSIYRRVTERRVYPNGGTNWDSRMTISKPDTLLGGAVQSDNFIEVDQYDSAGTVKTAERHYYFGHAWTSLQPNDPVGYSDWQEGKEYQTEALTSNASPALRQVLRRTVSVWDVTAPTRQFGPASNPRVIETDATLEPNGVNLTAKQTFSYDQYNNKTDVYEYDYGSTSPLRRGCKKFCVNGHR